MASSKFHFKEIDWIIYFPSSGNEGRSYLKYGVAYRDRARGISQPGVRINLEDVMMISEIQNNYPHKVGYFFNSTGRGENYTPQYLETRSVTCLEDFLQFLKDLNI